MTWEFMKSNTPSLQMRNRFGEVKELFKVLSWRLNGREFRTLWIVSDLLAEPLLCKFDKLGSSFSSATNQLWLPQSWIWNYATITLSTIPNCRCSHSLCSFPIPSQHSIPDSHDQPSRNWFACFRFSFSIQLRLICCSMVRVVLFLVFCFVLFFFWASHSLSAI